MELQQFNLSQPSQAIQVAETLQRFVKEKRLTANIQGKEYPLVEAWQFAGSQLGLYPICTEIKDISTPDEIKYFAKVEVRRFEDDRVVSNGFAICSNREHSKKRFDEYAIASMAQTRATGKAFRNLLAWLMKAAGFEATPAEEMDFVRDELTDDDRDFLFNLLESSSYEGKVRDGLRFKINAMRTKEEYQKAKQNLLDNQVGIDSVVNPSQADIKRHVRNISKMPQ